MTTNISPSTIENTSQKVTTSTSTTEIPSRITTSESLSSTLENLYPQDLSYTCPPPVNGCRGPKDCLYKNPDCTKYYQCNDGSQAFVRDCPLGTEWNDSQKICDFPQKANCTQ
jgi:hypothetical protein